MIEWRRGRDLAILDDRESSRVEKREDVKKKRVPNDRIRIREIKGGIVTQGHDKTLEIWKIQDEEKNGLVL